MRLLLSLNYVTDQALVEWYKMLGLVTSHRVNSINQFGHHIGRNTPVRKNAFEIYKKSLKSEKSSKSLTISRRDRVRPNIKCQINHPSNQSLLVREVV